MRVCEKKGHLMVLRSSEVSWFKAIFLDSAMNTALPERPWASLKGTWSEAHSHLEPHHGIHLKSEQNP